MGQKELAGKLKNGSGKYFTNGRQCNHMTFSCGSSNVVRIKTTQCCHGIRFFRASTAVIGQAMMTETIRMLGVRKSKNFSDSDDSPPMAAILSHKEKC